MPDMLEVGHSHRQNNFFGLKTGQFPHVFGFFQPDPQAGPAELYARLAGRVLLRFQFNGRRFGSRKLDVFSFILDLFDQG